MSDFQSFFGNPDVTTYDECLKIFDFAEMTSDDIFYDLGCGYGTVCIVAAQKYSPKKIIGIEARYENFLEATNRILGKNLEKKIILKNEFVENINFSEATLIYYSIKPNLNHLLHLSKMMKKNCRIVTPKIPLPTIKPKKTMKINNSNFYLMEGPLEKYKAKNSDEWARSISDYKHTGIKGLLEVEKNNAKWIKELISQIYFN